LLKAVRLLCGTLIGQSQVSCGSKDTQLKELKIVKAVKIFFLTLRPLLSSTILNIPETYFSGQFAIQSDEEF
jgi:hypothetical protein